MKPTPAFVKVVEYVKRPAEDYLDFEEFLTSGKYKEFERKMGNPFRTTCNNRKSHLKISLNAISGQIHLFHEYTT